MAEINEAQNRKTQTTEEQNAARKPDGVLTTKIGKQTLVMLLLAAFVGTWTITIWIWSAILLVECCVLLYLTRRL